MAKIYKSIIVWSMLAISCIVMLTMNSFAAAALDYNNLSGYKPGPGDHMDASGNIVSLSGEILVDSEGNVLVSNSVVENTPDAANAEAKTGGSDNKKYTVSTVDGDTVYTFDGKNYKLGASYGVHKLSGYSAEETGSTATSSGKTAKAGHTIACASDLPLGTVIFLKGSAGPYSSDYDGFYVVEDRGGVHIESDGWLDIFFNTLAEAAHVTDAGWNYAEAWVAEPTE